MIRTGCLKVVKIIGPGIRTEDKTKKKPRTRKTRKKKTFDGRRRRDVFSLNIYRVRVKSPKITMCRARTPYSRINTCTWHRYTTFGVDKSLIPRESHADEALWRGEGRRDVRGEDSTITLRRLAGGGAGEAVLAADDAKRRNDEFRVTTRRTREYYRVVISSNLQITKVASTWLNRISIFFFFFHELPPRSALRPYIARKLQRTRAIIMFLRRNGQNIILFSTVSSQFIHNRSYPLIMTRFIILKSWYFNFRQRENKFNSFITYYFISLLCI